MSYPAFLIDSIINEAETIGEAKGFAKALKQYLLESDDENIYCNITLKLTYCPSKIPAIKAFREVTGCGLKEAKDAVEGDVLFQTDNKDAAIKVLKVMKGVGCKIAITGNKSLEILYGSKQ